ncbi:hypothetical protein CPC08DRAFT_771815 [Agrocybe pediades]|nr:hypothetical protein CPC08DRAFT_771815 [Agrocybe pediades]
MGEEPSNKDERDRVSQHPAHRTSVPFSKTPPAAANIGLDVVINTLLAFGWVLVASLISLTSCAISIKSSRPYTSIKSLATSALDTLASSSLFAPYKLIFNGNSSSRRLPSSQEVISFNTKPISTNHPTSTLSSLQTNTSIVPSLLRHYHSLLKHPVDFSKKPVTNQLNSRLGSALERQKPQNEAQSITRTKERPLTAPASQNTPDLEYKSIFTHTITHCPSYSTKSYLNLADPSFNPARPQQVATSITSSISKQLPQIHVQRLPETKAVEINTANSTG